ncbi:hypothetical protein ATANTOWER_016180 [Ataeniobius toweri]|uniref:Uncharacterized protein n=1 Tax=Ataeniobius toweri TaxID=208326 RepID=A0ABU7AGY3_9TELE|nr:hypothetical protein [Ataeniobius toweri]
MDPEQRKRTTSTCLSVMSDLSKDDPPNFTVDERNSPSSMTDETNARASYPTDPSLKSYRSRTPPPDFRQA